MNKIYRLLILLTVVFNLYGCASSLPLVSHAHVGHALTTWHDTPDQVGLYVSARDEAGEALKIAYDHLEVDDAQRQQQAIIQIAYILNPDVIVLDDPDFGKRYGVIRALEGTLDHIEYAATSDDASLNFLSSISDITKNGELVVKQFNLIFEKSRQNLSSPDPGSTISQLYLDLNNAVNSRVENETVTVYGLRNFTNDFNAMLKREKDPRYEPLSRKYVLGLVRLPNGHWGYKLSSDTSSFNVNDY